MLLYPPVFSVSITTISFLFSVIYTNIFCNNHACCFDQIIRLCDVVCSNVLEHLIRLLCLLVELPLVRFFRLHIMLLLSSCNLALIFIIYQFLLIGHISNALIFILSASFFLSSAITSVSTSPWSLFSKTRLFDELKLNFG